MDHICRDRFSVLSQLVHPLLCFVTAPCMTSNVTTNNPFSLQLFTEFTPRGSFYPRIKQTKVLIRHDSLRLCPHSLTAVHVLLPGFAIFSIPLQQRKSHMLTRPTPAQKTQCIASPRYFSPVLVNWPR